MAKDPAVLLYVQDFLIGSSLLTPLQKGHYITLLCYQQQSESGSLTESQVLVLMGKDFSKHWPVLITKFRLDENGYYNERMRKEMARRQKFSSSQTAKVSKRWTEKKGYPGNTPVDTTVIPNIGNTFLETEIETEIGIKEVGTGETIKVWNCKPRSEDVGEVPDYTVGACIELLRITKKQVATRIQIVEIWDVFKVQNLTGSKFYPDIGAVHSHFINWIKNQDFSNGSTENKSANGSAVTGTSAARVSKAKQWGAKISDSAEGQ